MFNKFNYWIYRKKYQYARSLPLTKPVDISLELTSYCNQRCVYCYHADQKSLPFKKETMSKELAYSIINEASFLGVHSIKFNGRGESTTYPFFYDVVSHAYDLGTFQDRITNSNFNFNTKNTEIFEALSKQTKVKVSFDSFRKDVIEKVRVGTDYEKALRNIQIFHDCYSFNTKLVIQAVRTKLNADEDLEYEIKKRFPNATASIRDMVTGRINTNLSDLKNKDRSNERESCVQAHARIVIHSNGKVAPCCPAFKGDLIIGDMNTQSISDVWNSYQAKQLRINLLNKEAFKTNPCKTCSSMESYKGWKAPKDS